MIRPDHSPDGSPSIDSHFSFKKSCCIHFSNMMAQRLLLGFVVILATTGVCRWESSALTLVPRINLPRNLPICMPDAIPAIVLPDDFANCSEAVAESLGRRHPDQDKTTEEIVTSYGYSVEVHNVTTHDGYILNVHRITGGPVSPPAPGKPSVYVNHGMGGASDSWLIQYGDRNLAFKLADAGYDVWLGNCRGTTYSLQHETLNAETDNQYWDFSWHEMAMGDVPAVVDKMIAVSGNAKISYIGYSMGGTQYFIALSSIPELNDKIEKGILLAPVGFQGHANNPVRVLSPLALTGAQRLVSPLILGKVDTFKAFQKYTNISVGDLCTPMASRCGLCDNFMYFGFGFDVQQQNYTNIPNIFSKFPNNMSFKTLVHFSQSQNTCQFRQYDYGPIENRRRYGSIQPPKYELTRIRTPTYMFYGDADNMATPTDVNLTADNMDPSTVKGMYRVNWELFNHLDFQFAKDADTLVYDKVLEILQQ